LGHTATLLPNGEVLVAGGNNEGLDVASTELYDPALGTWTATGSLATARYGHTATLLPNGKVLVAGGFGGGAAASAELYDPASGTWSVTGSLGAARYGHTATLLPNGKVLVTGGSSSSGALASAEVYDPASGTWTATSSLATARASHTATLLPNGKVLVAGGANGSGYLASAEVYDPASGTWSATGSLATARYVHSATLLPYGTVLVAGGYNSTSAATSVEVYNPANATWTPNGNLGAARANHTATLLPNGKVLVAGGEDSSFNALASAELYDPASGTWSATGSLATARYVHSATLLPYGTVLVAGGNNVTSNSYNYLASAELYDVGLSFSSAWQPQIATAPSTLSPAGSLALTGTRFQGISQASGGNTQDSSSNYPIVQLRSIDSSQVTFLPVDSTAGWSNTSFTSTPITGFPLGPALVTVFTNGIPSDASYLLVGFPVLTFTTQASAGVNSGGSVSDTAMLSGGNAPTGTITFSLYGPDDSSCNGTPVVSSTVPVTGATSYSSGSFTVTTPGTYRWVARYSGDANNSAVTTACDDASETVVVNPAPTPTPIPSTTPTPTPTPVGTPPLTTLANISTRLRVETGDNALIGGFIVTGTQPKKVMIRAIGPSLPFADKLADPILELHDSSGALLDSNDNWQDSPNKQAIIDSTIAPSDPLESAIIATLPANGSGYTAIVRGVNNGTGIGVVEAYDLDTSVDSKLANISTRGLVQTGDNVLIAGTIVVGQGSQKVIVEALGPSLSVPGKLEDPILELRDGNGGLVDMNDNWVDSPNKQAIIDSTIPPGNDFESAILATLPADGAQYTAIVRGVNGTSGIAVVEVFALN
jgi:hypothetical protein